ncbi:DUF3024 domain-containing protein [Paenibacillus luteus]|uniref:DUF3024 domain-containing protein n=1 Tax=Paenibacillus luteus TaxID=2545753 RepID=UPI001F4FB799|nr:DUF3024 domain-containing protein [Paenibacillus luteus]
MMDPFTLRRIESIMDGYIHQKVPGDLRVSIRLKHEIVDNQLTLAEERATSLRNEWVRVDIVQFRLESQKWNVYAKNGENTWSFVEIITPSEDFERQLEQVEIDQDGLFWKS